MSTYSLGVVGFNSNHKFPPNYSVAASVGYTVKGGGAGPILPDDVSNSPQAMQQAMASGKTFMVKAPDGSLVNAVFDAERSIPGVLPVIRRV